MTTHTIIPTVLPGDELTVELERTGSSLGMVALLTVNEGGAVAEVRLGTAGVDALIFSLSVLREDLS